MKPKPKEIIQIFFHFIIAFFLLIAYQEFGETFKYFAAPYVLYMVIRENPLYYPAIFINVAGGSTISFVVLVGCLILTIKHFRYLSHRTNIGLLLISLLPAPVLFYQAFYRYYFLNTDIINSVIPLGFYLGVFPFFYGIIISRKISNHFFKILFFLLIFVMIFNLLNFMDSLRISAITLSLYSLIGLLLIPTMRMKMRISIFYKLIGVLAIASILIGFIEIKFHFLGSVLLSFLITILYLSKKNLLIDFFTKKRLVVFMIIIIIYIMSVTFDYSLSNVPFSSFSYYDITSYPQFIIYKAFADRGVIWNAVWSDLLYYQYLIPPIFVYGYSYTSISGAKMEVEFGAHNLFLELLRQYGLLFGMIVSVSYISMIVYVGKVFKIERDDFYFILLASTIFGIGVVVGLTGMYTLMINFSFLFMGLAGLLYGYSFTEKELVKSKQMIGEQSSCEI